MLACIPAHNPALIFFSQKAMEEHVVTIAVNSPACGFVPILLHHGCTLCMEVYGTISSHIPGLVAVDLSRVPQFKKEARELGVSVLPSLVVGNQIISVSAHIAIDNQTAPD